MSGRARQLVRVLYVKNEVFRQGEFTDWQSVCLLTVCCDEAGEGSQRFLAKLSNTLLIRGYRQAACYSVKIIFTNS